MAKNPPLLRAAFLTLLLHSSLGCAHPDAGLGDAIRQRADKVVAPLHLTDAATASRVRDLVAHEYHALSQLHADRDARLQAAKSTGDGKASAESAAKKIRAEIEAKQDQLHANFLAALASDLTPDQIDQIKDGMTYGVLPKTYRAYTDMLPDLTTEQKAQILAWLTEAREHALTAGSSEEKHAWFGKYKGRITNYLTAAGYDLKSAEKAWLARSK